MNHIFLRTFLRKLFRVWDEYDEKQNVQGWDREDFYGLYFDRLQHIREIVEHDPTNATESSEAPEVNKRNT